jgi:hypothetical protein
MRLALKLATGAGKTTETCSTIENDDSIKFVLAMVLRKILLGVHQVAEIQIGLQRDNAGGFI